MNLTHEYPQISQLVTISNQKLIETIDRIKGNVTRKQEVIDDKLKQNLFNNLHFHSRNMNNKIDNKKNFVSLLNQYLNGLNRLNVLNL